MDDENRPDPDELLSRITAEEGEDAQENSQRGKLKIFFGACAGVGPAARDSVSRHAAFRVRYRRRANPQAAAAAAR
jgi:hypothetical protein